MDDQNIIRRCANFQPSVWSDEYIQSLNSEYKDESYIKQNEVLKEDVRELLCKLVNLVDQLEMIDVLQRLAIGYHFNNEIRKILEKIHNNMDILKRENLHVTSLAFRLLRQHRFNVSTDVFTSFQDTMGNFKKCLSDDVNGLLSLYEVSFLSMENEHILDEARDFTINFLKEYVNFINIDSDTSLLINHALEFPLHWTLPRMEALWFINFLSQRRKNVSPTVIQFAELDFNIAQSIHQDELKDSLRWWEKTGLFKELGFFRNRPVENFLWAVDMNFKPEVRYFREVDTKVNAYLTILDDLYDVYGKLDELELFTEAIDGWDLNAMDNLPHYMKIIFLSLYNFVSEVAFVYLKENGYNIIPYLKKVWADLCKSYLIEAKWFYSGHTPKLEEYMENAWISIAVPVGLMHTYFLLSTPSKKEDLICIGEYPNIIRFAATISRLVDDLGTLEREMETGDVSKSIQCYMNETGASDAESREHLMCIMHKTWKKLNEEALNSPFSENFTYAIVNLTRAALLFYQHGDGFSIPNRETKSRLQSLIMEPISTHT